MLEGLCSVVSLSLVIVVLTSNMIQPMARRSYFPITSRKEAKPPDNNNEDGAIRKYYPMDIETPEGDRNNFLGAIIGDIMVPSLYQNKKSCPENQLENCNNRGVFLREKYHDPESDLFNNIERQEKFDYFRRAEDVMVNPALPAGTPMNFHKQYSMPKYSRNHKTL